MVINGPHCPTSNSKKKKKKLNAIPITPSQSTPGPSRPMLSIQSVDEAPHLPQCSLTPLPTFESLVKQDMMLMPLPGEVQWIVELVCFAGVRAVYSVEQYRNAGESGSKDFCYLTVACQPKSSPQAQVQGWRCEARAFSESVRKKDSFS